MQHKLDKKYSVGKILESLVNCNCYPIENNIYMFSFLNDVGTVVDIDFTKKYMQLADIKKILANSKK